MQTLNDSFQEWTGSLIDLQASNDRGNIIVKRLEMIINHIRRYINRTYYYYYYYIFTILIIINKTRGY